MEQGTQGEMQSPNDPFDDGFQVGKLKKSQEIFEPQTAERVALILA